MKKYLVFAGIGFELIAAILLADWVSVELEKKFDSKGMISLGIYFLVLIAWFVHIFFLLKKVQKNESGS